MSASLVWITPDPELHIMRCARVSSTDPKSDKPGILAYMIQHHHWSPFEMVNVCIEIIAPRDIGRQILRHRSFSFQEFSQRYAIVESSDKDPDIVIPLREARLQDVKNRQHSLEMDDSDEQVSKKRKWSEAQQRVRDVTREVYEEALGMGLAKEVARAVLPEGLTPTKMYMNGTLRSWIHYINQRTDPSTQKEHALIAQQIKEILINIVPTVAKGLKWV